MCQQDGVCATCMASFAPSANGNQCVCPDNSFTIVNSACACPTQTTLYNNHCYSCTVPQCSQCQTDNICSTCTSPFLTDTTTNTCVCPPTFVKQGTNPVCVCPDTSSQQGNTCICPTGSTLSAQTCVSCSVQYCTLCNQPNVCATCLNNLQPATVNGASVCQCADNTFVINAQNTCVCPAGTLLQGSTCVACSVSNCVTCPTLTTCTTCANTFTLANDVCSCPTGFTLFQNVCYDCSGVQFCQTCSNTNVCQTCTSPFVLNSGICQCAQGYTLNPNTNQCI